jgi:oligopeptide/dipeptide ABC transporter ATP-binding protein
MSENILDVQNLKIHFYTEEGELPVINGVDFSLREGEIMSIVGESGCGKSVTAMSILGLIPNPPGKIVDGEIKYKGNDLTKLSNKEMEKIRGNEISMIFQEPMTSLNPVYTVGKQIMESLKYHQRMKAKEAKEKAIELISLVGISTPERFFYNYPHQLSGGMRQRIMIAIALACNPRILIADEPTTALDVTIQAQIMSLMVDLKKKTGTSIILITHDFGVVSKMAEKVIVMYAGEVVEECSVKEIFRNTLHPYSEGLLKSVPTLKDEKEYLYNIKGTVPTPKDFLPGCRFAPRCEYATDKCLQSKPQLREVEPGHKVRCWNRGA